MCKLLEPTLYFGQKYYNGRNDKPWICKLRAKNREKKKGNRISLVPLEGGKQ